MCQNLSTKVKSAARWTSTIVCGLLASSVISIGVASLATVEAAMLRPAFFAGKWAANEEMCKSSNSYVAFMPGQFKFAAAVDKTPYKVTYYQAKADRVDVGLSHPALQAKVTFVKGEGGTLTRKDIDVSIRDLSDAEWHKLMKMSNGMITRASIDSKMKKFKAEVASYPDYLVRCSAGA